MGFRILVQYVHMHLACVYRADHKGSFRQRQLHQEQNESVALFNDHVLPYKPDNSVYLRILRRR